MSWAPWRLPWWEETVYVSHTGRPVIFIWKLNSSCSQLEGRVGKREEKELGREGRDGLFLTCVGGTNLHWIHRYGLRISRAKTCHLCHQKSTTGWGNWTLSLRFFPDLTSVPWGHGDWAQDCNSHSWAPPKPQCSHSGPTPRPHPHQPTTRSWKFHLLSTLLIHSWLTLWKASLPDKWNCFPAGLSDPILVPSDPSLLYSPNNLSEHRSGQVTWPWEDPRGPTLFSPGPQGPEPSPLFPHPYLSPRLLSSCVLGSQNNF